MRACALTMKALSPALIISSMIMISGRTAVDMAKASLTNMPDEGGSDRQLKIVTELGKLGDCGCVFPRLLECHAEEDASEDDVLEPGRFRIHA